MNAPLIHDRITADRISAGAINAVLITGPEHVHGSRAERMLLAGMSTLLAMYLTLVTFMATLLVDDAPRGFVLGAALVWALVTTALDFAATRAAKADGHLIRVQKATGPFAAALRVQPYSAPIIAVAAWHLDLPLLIWAALLSLLLYTALVTTGFFMTLTGRMEPVWDVVVAPPGTTKHRVLI